MCPLLSIIVVVIVNQQSLELQVNSIYLSIMSHSGLCRSKTKINPYRPITNVSNFLLFLDFVSIFSVHTIFETSEKKRKRDYIIKSMQSFHGWIDWTSKHKHTHIYIIMIQIVNRLLIWPKKKTKQKRVNRWSKG